jgi:4-amino-4-deoxy-L-arabinose transferase-like glycosyltransferase
MTNTPSYLNQKTIPALRRRKSYLVPDSIEARANMRSLIILALIFLLALALNLINLSLKPITQDIGETWRWWPEVLSLAQNHAFQSCIQVYFPFCGPTNNISAALEPLPVLFFAAGAFISNQSLWFARIMEVGLNLLILLGIYLLAETWLNQRAALIASLIWATYIPAIKLVAQISGDLFATACLVFGMVLFMRARRSQRWPDWIFTGVLMGLGILSRSVILPIVLILALGLIIESWQAHPNWRANFIKIIRPAVVMLSLAILLIIPWAFRNYKVLGKPVYGSTLVGYNLYRQNYMLGEQNYLRFVGLKEADQAVSDLVARRQDSSGTENEAQMDSVYRAEALKIITAHPVQYASLTIYRFLPLWFNWGVQEAYGSETNIVWYAVMILQAFLLVTALIGAWITRRQSWPFWVSIVVVSLSYMAIISELRYLVLVMPLVICLSVMGLQSIGKRFSSNPAR